MKFNRIYFLIIVFLFVSLLFSYYYFAKTSPNFLKLWGRIPDSKKTIYYISVLITLIGFIVFLYYLWISDSFENNNKNLKLFIILVIFLLLSISWAPLSLKYLNNKSVTLKYQIILVLFLIPLSLLYPIYVLYKLNDKKYTMLKNISLGLIIYYCLHTFILDAIIWNINFF
jgi:heme A synthase